MGAGPWAEKAYGPMLAAGPETRLAAVWARRPEAAAALAGTLGTVAAGSFDALLERCDAVAFAVPPDVQADLAARAALAGKHLLLDKPLALTVEQARGVVAAVERAGVVTQLMLTHRFRLATTAFLERAKALPAVGARLAFVTSAFVRGPYANSWRREHGAFHDLGPHAFDLLEAALGPIVDLAGRGDPRRFVALACRHESGAVSDVVMSGVITLPRTVFRLEIFGAENALEFDAVAASEESPWARARESFAAAVRAGRSPALDARHGLHLQELIERALRAVTA